MTYKFRKNTSCQQFCLPKAGIYFQFKHPRPQFPFSARIKCIATNPTHSQTSLRQAVKKLTPFSLNVLV